ncbi:hypothetical protein M8J75_007569 [Diaphorina citri]|nr:hypothetical protein M8J75_007569 [Diaphorina citri]
MDAISPSRGEQQYMHEVSKMKQIEYEDSFTDLDILTLMNSYAKTKTETRGSSEKLSLLAETIKESKILDILKNTAVQRKVEEIKPPTDPEPTEELICSRCKKALMEEKELATEIQSLVAETHTENADVFNENIKKLVERTWPEEAYHKTTAKIGNPLTDAEDADFLLVLKSPEDTTFITSKFKEKYTGLKDILEKENTKDQVQYLENITRTRNSVESCTRVYVTCGDTMENYFKALKDLQTVMIGGRKKIAVVTPDQKLRVIFRKLSEIMLLQSDVYVEFFLPKRESRNFQKENKFDTIVVNSASSSYSDMLKSMRETINPDEMGLQVKSVRKMKDDALLIVTERENAQRLKEEILKKSNIPDIQIVEKKCMLLITGMDAVTTEEEITGAIERETQLTDKTKVQIKTMMKIQESDRCIYCQDEEDTPKHMFFQCDRWRMKRTTCWETLGAVQTEQTIIAEMIKDKTRWNCASNFISEIVKNKKMDTQRLAAQADARPTTPQ